jgi:crossover junction endodeoxyribonuclease RuvC
MIYIGIDPGKNGAMCLLDNENLEFIDFDLKEYIAKLSKLSDIRACIESVHAMPGQGVSSCFTFGQRLGELEGILMTLQIPYELVPPKTWQKACGIQPKSDKKTIANVITKLYPTADIYGSRGGLKDGRSDALGLAHYLRLKYKG